MSTSATHIDIYCFNTELIIFNLNHIIIGTYSLTAAFFLLPLCLWDLLPTMYAKPDPHKHIGINENRQLRLCAKTQGWTKSMSRPQKPELCTCPARAAATHCAKHFPQQHIPAASIPAAHLFMSESTTGHHVDEAWEQKLKGLVWSQLFAVTISSPLDMSV